MKASMNSTNIETSLLDDPTNHRRQPVAGLTGVKYATEATDRVSHQALAGGNATGAIKKLSIQDEHRIGTWNVRGLLQAGKLTIVEKEAERYRLSILGLSETHMRGQGHFTTTQGNTLYFSGCEDKSINGVAILIPSFLNKHVLGYNPVSDRVITLKLNTRPTAMHIIQVYVPTGNASEEIIDDFYAKLTQVISEIPSRDTTIILGDWNAKIGSTFNDDHIRTTVGKHGLGARNDRGHRLLEFCIEMNLSIMNTFFQHHPRRLYTWTSPGARYRNQIDYIIISKRWRSSIQNVKTYPGAECGSDHNLLVAKFNLRLKAPRKNLPTKLRSLNPIEQNQLRDAIEAKLTDSPLSGDNASTAWDNLKSIIWHNVDIVTRNRESNSIERKKRMWITNHTWKLIQRRKDIKVKGLQNDHVRGEYSDLSKSIKKDCRRDKNTYIMNICKEIEEHSIKYQTHDLFKKVRVLCSDFKPKTWVVEDKDGKPIHELESVLEIWRDYCENLYQESDVTTLTTYQYCHDWNDFDIEPEILHSEVEAAINLLKKRKAPGPDQITAEVLQALGEKGIWAMHKICNYVWMQGKWPSDWTESTVLPLHKKGSTRVCGNYRTLALISHGSKVLLHILNNRIRHFLDWQISPEQAGFVKGKGTREQILNIRQLIEKSYEFNTPLVLCFIDYSKAFDCVNWSSLWTVLSELGVPQHLISLIHSLYVNNRGVVRVENTLSKPFKFAKGVRQGCILSPILFNAYGEYIMRRTLEDWEGGVSIGGTKITNLRYADDTTLVATDEVEMATLLERMERISEELGLSINKAKTKIMVVDRTKQLELTGTLNLQYVDSFSYLGSTVCNDGSCELDVRKRIGMAKSAMSRLGKVWADRAISRKTKISLVKTLVFSIFLYGAETWTLKKADRTRIDAFEMWCWRKMLRIPWTAHRTNVSVLREVGVPVRLSNICLRRIFGFFGHIARKESDNLEKLLVTGKIQGKRPRGRSPLRWSDQIRNSTNKNVHEVIHIAEDRSKWKEIVRKVIRGGHDPQQ